MREFLVALEAITEKNPETNPPTNPVA